MRPLTLLAVLAPVALAACGAKEKTVVVNPPAQTQVAPPASSNTVVVPGGTKVCPPGYTAC
jgi:hypothetical protein